MLIPRIFHQIWVGPDPLPDEFRAYGQTWLDHHPGWELKLWTDENFPPEESLIRPESANPFRAPWERGDIFRLEILYKEGGVHVDTDFECKKSIEPLIEDATLFIGLNKPHKTNGALMGSVPGHPLVEKGLREIIPQTGYGKSMATGDNLKTTTGPQFLDWLLIGQDDVTFVAPEHFYARTPEDRRNAYAIHHKARSWKDEKGLRRLLEKNEQKIEALEEEVETLRAKLRELGHGG